MLETLQEPIFAPCNKKETSLMDQFFTALVSSSKIPTALGGDAQDLLNILKAEVNSVTAVRASLDKMNQQKHGFTLYYILPLHFF